MKNLFKGAYKPQNTLDDKIYYYLQKNAVGREKRVKSGVLMDMFNIEDNKTLRSHIENIRDNMDYEYIICSEAGQNGGYWIATSEQEVFDTLQHFYKRSMKMLYTYARIKNKLKLNKQMQIKLETMELDIYNSILGGE